MSEIEFVPLLDVIDEIIDNRGKTVPTEEEGFPLIATNCIKLSSIYPTFENVRYVSEETLNTWFRAHLKPNDILFVNKGTPGRTCLVPNPVNFCVAQDMMAFRCNQKKIYYKYLFAVLRSDWIKKKIENYHVGLVIPHFKKQDLNNILIPQKTRQEQIIIGDLYFTLSSKIELNNQINQKLEAMAKTLYDYWFVQFDFPDANGKPYKSSGGKMVYNEELKREIPEGWEAGTLDDIGEIVGGSTPSTKDINNFCSNGIPWITPKDLSNNKSNKFISHGEIDITQAGMKDASLKIYPEDTVLMSSRAPVGYLAIASNPLTTNQGFKSFIPNKGFSKEFIFYTLNLSLSTIIKNASGSTFKEISKTVLKDVRVVLPEKSFVSNFEKLVSPLFAKQQNLEFQNQKLSQLRDWLLPMLMNGQVTVSEAQEMVEELMAVEPSVEYGKS